MGAAFSLLYPSLSLIVVSRVSDTRRGAALGTFTAFFDAGVGLGAPLAGAMAALTSYEGAFFLSAAIALVSAATIALAVRPGGRRADRRIVRPETTRAQRCSISSDWAARPMRPRWSERTDSAVPMPLGWGRVTASMQTHSPSGMRSKWTVRSTLMKT